MKKEDIEFTLFTPSMNSMTFSPTYDMYFLPRIGELIHSDTFFISDAIFHEFYKDCPKEGIGENAFYSWDMEYFKVTEITHQFYKGRYTVSLFLELPEHDKLRKEFKDLQSVNPHHETTTY
jgi:hypothetical protein